MNKTTYRVYFSDGNQKLFESYNKKDLETYLLDNGYNIDEFEITIA
jgi:hypothetical protein